MRVHHALACAAAVSAPALMLAGCGSIASTGAAGNGVSTQSFVPPQLRLPSPLSVAAAGTYRVQHQVRAARPPKGKPALYVSDAVADTIDEFSKAGKEIGTITGLEEPQGITLDKKGNLYVANTAASEILVFSPGSSSPAVTVETTNEYPVGVAVDSSGNIWVSNIEATTGAFGSIKEYSSSGTYLQKITCSGFEKPYFIAVDANDNVFVDGFASNQNAGPTAVEVTAGSTSCTTLPSVKFKFPGGLQMMANGDLVVDDQTGLTITEYAAPNFTSVVNTITLTSATSVDPIGISMTKKDKDVWISDAANLDAYEFAYPSGTSPIKTIGGASSGVFSQPIGIASYPLAAGNGAVTR